MTAIKSEAGLQSFTLGEIVFRPEFNRLCDVVFSSAFFFHGFAGFAGLPVFKWDFPGYDAMMNCKETIAFRFGDIWIINSTPFYFLFCPWFWQSPAFGFRSSTSGTSQALLKNPLFNYLTI
jgi:hypothetical protein